MSFSSQNQSNFIFRISPLIRITLFCFYLALTVPLPFLAKASSAPISPLLLWLGISLGAIAVYGALSERVILDEDRIQVAYPSWVSLFWLKGWSLKWSEIDNLKMRTTGQGGLVYYFITAEGGHKRAPACQAGERVTKSADRAYLLPMRVAGFAAMLKIVEERTNINTQDIRPLSQPWMYLILLLFTFLLWLIDGWTIWTAVTLGLA